MITTLYLNSNLMVEAASGNFGRLGMLLYFMKKIKS